MGIVKLNNRQDGAYHNLLCYLSWFFSYPFIRPKILQIDITHRCNLDCRMCSIKRYPASQADETTQEEIAALLTQAKELGVQSLVIAGGEPLLRTDLFEICGHAQEVGISPVIVTNGTLIDADRAREMAQKFSGTVSISLDGEQKNHDYLRGEGAFKRTVEGIRRLADAQKAQGKKGIFVQLGLIITKSNFRGLVAMVDLAKSLEVDSLYFIPLMRDNTNLQEKEDDPYLWPTGQEIDELEIILEEAAKKARECGVNLEEKIPRELLIRYYRGGISGRHWACYGGIQNVFITLCNPEGKSYYQPYVRICMEFVGNIRKQALRDIWFSRNAFAARRRTKYCKAPCMQPCFPGRMLNRPQALLRGISKALGL